MIRMRSAKCSACLLPLKRGGTSSRFRNAKTAKNPLQEAENSYFEGVGVGSFRHEPPPRRGVNCLQDGRIRPSFADLRGLGGSPHLLHSCGRSGKSAEFRTEKACSALSGALEKPRSLLRTTSMFWTVHLPTHSRRAFKELEIRTPTGTRGAVVSPGFHVRRASASRSFSSSADFRRL